MGLGMSREDVQRELDTDAQKRKDAWEKEQLNLRSLDQATRVPHLLIEIRSLGYVELQGKDTGGIYARLDEWLQSQWQCRPLATDLVEAPEDDDECCCCGCATVGLKTGPLQEYDRLCDRSYSLGPNVYQAQGVDDSTNMGKLTMQLVDFMTHSCGWTLHLCDGGNLGWRGQIQEQQIKFKAPHPLNLIAPHIMIELRQVGYVEINGPDTDGIHSKLEAWLKKEWSSRASPDTHYCDARYATDAFRSRGNQGENNMGLRTVQVVDFMVKQCGWTMVTCNGSNFGRKGTERQQQLVFRKDQHVQHGENHIMVELRTSGYIEVNGLHDAQDLATHLDGFFKETWRCTEYTPYPWEIGSEMFTDKKYSVPGCFYHRGDDQLTNNLGKRTLELASCMAEKGWALLLCNSGSITPDPVHSPSWIIREQQIKFTKVANLAKAKEPLLMVELRTVPVDFDWAGRATIEGRIEVNGPDVGQVYQKLECFITKHMGGFRLGRDLGYCDLLFSCDAFRCKESRTHYGPRCRAVEQNSVVADGRLNGESNIGKWTIRLCDFLVDHDGEWDLIVCNSDSLQRSLDFKGGSHKIGVTAREMQLVFRHKPKGRSVFMSAPQAAPLGRSPLHPPGYWREGSQQGALAHAVLPGTPQEMLWMQQLLDSTYRDKTTRDRRGGKLARRFVAVQCLRSEQPALWDSFAKRRQAVLQACQGRGGAGLGFAPPKTAAACPELHARCVHAEVGNPTGQAFLFHGTNPTAAVAVLGTSFKVDFAGKSAGTMFGAGIYLAEASSKADEYAQDDSGGEYDGLYALLVCRAVIGKPFVTEKPGDYAKQVTSGEFDVVVGDREKAVDTFREFIFFHEDSVYPEYAVFYRREYDKPTPAPQVVGAPAMQLMEY